MPLPEPRDGEQRDEFVQRCVPLAIEDQGLDAADGEDRAQAVAICNEIWRDTRAMNANTKLIEAIRERRDQSAPICTADHYVRRAIEEAGEGLIKATFGSSAKSLLKRAEKQLVVSHPAFATYKQTSNPSEFGDLLPQFESLPDGVKKHAALIDLHTVTTPDEDRDKDILVSEGAKIDPKLPTLWMHMQDAVLGKMVWVIEKSAAGIRLASVLLGGSELRDDAVLLTEAEALRWSHGFIAEQFEERKDRGFKVLVWEMLEESKVAVPSNRGAETDQIISVFAGGKLQSDYWKAVGKHYHDLRPAQMQVPTQLKLRLGDAELDLSTGLAQPQHASQEGPPEEEKAAEPSAGEPAEQSKEFVGETNDHGHPLSRDELERREAEPKGADPLPEVGAEETDLDEADKTPASISGTDDQGAGVQEKAGRVMSQANLDTLKNVRDDLDELLGMDNRNTRGATSLLKGCKGELDRVIKQADMKPEDEEKEEPKASPRDGLAALLACEDKRLQRHAVESLAAHLKVKELNDLAEQFREVEEAFA